MKYIIGVDCGGTKTEAVAYNLEDKELGRGLSSSSNLIIDFYVAANNIVDAITKCKDNIKNKGIAGKCLGIYLGIAGIEVFNNKERIESELNKGIHCPIRTFHDSELAHAGIFEGKDGIITISGTGSVSYGLYKGKSARVGGWGHVLGDEGSGYDIALTAFKQIALEFDLGEKQSLFSQAILNRFNMKNANNIKELIYSATKGEISSYALIIDNLANESNKDAVEILKAAGKKLAVMTERVYNKLDIDDKFDIGIWGSILLKTRIVHDEFIACVKQNLPGSTILAAKSSATEGACYLHRKEYR